MIETSFSTATKRRSGTLRRELSARNVQRAALHEHETTWGETPSVVYTPSDDGTHGNFFPVSYKRILANAAWKDRLGKAYTASKRIAHSAGRHRHELDCAASSDALLMNIFCHPQTVRSSRLARLLGRIYI